MSATRTPHARRRRGAAPGALHNVAAHRGSELRHRARRADRDPGALVAGADHRPDVRRAAQRARCSARAARSLAQLLYLAEGAIGLPVFAGGAAGLAEASSGRPAATWWRSRSRPRSPACSPSAAGIAASSRMLAAMLLGSVVIFACGLARLSRFVPGDALLRAGTAAVRSRRPHQVVARRARVPVAWRWARARRAERRRRHGARTR